MFFENTWNKITAWFHDRSERAKLIAGFNEMSRESFVKGETPTVLKASSSRGCSAYKHEFSAWLNTGFRIQALSGRQLSKNEMDLIGLTILSDTTLVRRLIVLGWDTLEVCDNTGGFGCRWSLVEYANNRGFLGVGKIEEVNPQIAIEVETKENLAKEQKHAVVKLLAFIQGSSPQSVYNEEANSICKSILSQLGVSESEKDLILMKSMCNDSEKEIDTIINSLKSLDEKYLNELHDNCCRIARISGIEDMIKIVETIFEKELGLKDGVGDIGWGYIFVISILVAIFVISILVAIFGISMIMA